jgi:hypothetical protein
MSDHAVCVASGAEDEQVGAIASIEQGTTASRATRSRDVFHVSARAEGGGLFARRVTRGTSVDNADHRPEQRVSLGKRRARMADVMAVGHLVLPLSEI